MDEELATKLRKTRFLHYVTENEKTGCLEWTGVRYKRGGYGQFFWGTTGGKEKIMRASRAAWILFRGEIPEGGNILHKCNNPPCCNVEHLYVGSHRDNARDRDLAGHTSRLEHRYNWKRSSNLIEQIKAMLPSGMPLQKICDDLGIGWQTMYRARNQDEELKRMIKETKSLRYYAGGVKAYKNRSS